MHEISTRHSSPHSICMIIAIAFTKQIYSSFHCDSGDKVRMMFVFHRNALLNILQVTNTAVLEQDF